MKKDDIKKIFTAAFPELSCAQIERISLITDHMVLSCSIAVKIKVEERILREVKEMIEGGKHDVSC